MLLKELDCNLNEANEIFMKFPLQQKSADHLLQYLAWFVPKVQAMRPGNTMLIPGQSLLSDCSVRCTCLPVGCVTHGSFRSDNAIP